MIMWFNSGDIVLFWTLISVCLSNLNLFLDVQETQRLLGLKGELYYVRKGIINEGALKFDMPLTDDITEIYFTWQNLRVSSPPMVYKMAFRVSKPDAMIVPFANVSHSHIVPTNQSVFQVKLLCTGDVTADLDIFMQVNITLFPDTNFTVLNFKRRKTCHADKLIGYDVTGNVTLDDLPSIESNDSAIPVDGVASSTNIFYIAVGCACSIILLVALGVAGFYVTTTRSGNRGYTQPDAEPNSSPLLNTHGILNQRPDTTTNSSSGNVADITVSSTTKKPYHNPNDLDAEEVDCELRQLEVNRDKICINEVLIEGTFGRVLRATVLNNEDTDDNQHECFVKTVTDQARDDQIVAFLSQCCMLRGLSHENINPVFKTCLDDPKQPLILYHLTNQGNLKKFLQKCHVMDGGSHYSLSTQQRVYMAIQLIRAAQYLHRKRVLHRDIATRNCFIDSGLMLKLSDNALSRDLFPADYNCLGDNENRPVKWLAIEALKDHRFSPAADIWAFGVTLWELMTLGQIPYADIDPSELAEYLEEGYRIPQPINCPDELYSLMSSCWQLSPQKRPKLSYLLSSLTDFYTALGRFV